jgi:hypothetical protein
MIKAMILQGYQVRVPLGEIFINDLSGQNKNEIDNE